jgi:hypothetical protein
LIAECWAAGLVLREDEEGQQCEKGRYETTGECKPDVSVLKGLPLSAKLPAYGQEAYEA